MDIERILQCVDHTVLSQVATTKDIMQAINDAVLYNTASVCIPPSFVAMAKEYAKGSIKICTVVGFPNGYNTTKAKVCETKDAIEQGADEIDMVINLGHVKDGRWDNVASEIRQIKEVCQEKVLKVIVETCLLTDQEKIELCKIVTDTAVDYIKTSTGFSTGGASRKDIEIFNANIGEKVKIKASGGIKTLQDAQDYIDLGCSRLGTSSIIKIVKENKE